MTREYFFCKAFAALGFMWAIVQLGAGEPFDAIMTTTLAHIVWSRV